MVFIVVRSTRVDASMMDSELVVVVGVMMVVVGVMVVVRNVAQAGIPKRCETRHLGSFLSFLGTMVCV